MEFTIEFGGEPQDVTITSSGVADLAGLRRLDSELASHPSFRPGLLILFENSQLDMSALSESDVEWITAEIAQRDWDVPPRAVAIVAPNLDAFIGARHVVAHLGGSQSRRRVFTSRSAAIAWLREQRS